MNVRAAKMNAVGVRRFPLYAKDSEDRGRHPEVLAALGGEPRRMDTSTPRPSFETPRERAAPQDDGRGAQFPAVAFRDQSSREIAMFRKNMFRKNSWISRAAIAAACMLLPAASAFASQGPGGGMGTAGNFTQAAMAVLVYGASALIVGAGLIGALRRR
jgi:hypothetical protein